MATETVADKTNRLLTDHCVFVRLALPSHVVAVVHGDNGTYSVDLTAGRWSCTCEARRTCSHMTAVMRVTTPKEND